LKALVIDHSIFPALALRLAAELGEEIGYHSPPFSSFPDPRDQLIGAGLEDYGVKRVDFLWEQIQKDTPEIFVFPDLFFSDLQDYLRNEGYNVWGGGWGELLELDRWKLYRVLRAAGEPVPDMLTASGIDDLAFKLREDRQFVKIAQYYRGLCETYEWRGHKASGSWLAGLRKDVMPAELRYMIQPPIEGKAVEPGLDKIVVNGLPLFPMLMGYEKKDSALLSMVIEEIPEWAAPVFPVLDELADYNYTNFASAEIRRTKDESFLTDFTARLPRPGDGIHMKIWSNLGTVIEQGARGKPMAPHPVAKYAGQLVFNSQHLADNPLHVIVPPEYEDNVILWRFTRDKDGDLWVLPNILHDTQVGSVVVVGDSIDEIKEQCLEIAGSIKADQLTFERDAFDEIEKDIDQGGINGAQWG
jgi:hypothetical protein